MATIARLFLIAALVGLPSCGGDESAAPGSPDTRPIPDRDNWWKEATTHPSGRERILAPRELRALLVAGERHGFDGNKAWWRERRDWVFSRILEMDPDDVEANSAMGRKTLQSAPGFADLWRRIVEAEVPNDAILDLLDRYYVWVQDGRPIFLTRDEFEVATAALREARLHLDRLDGDPEYAALQQALARVKGTSLSDYPFVHAVMGPFLVFFAAQDLQRIEGEDEDAEESRVRERREFYLGQLAALEDVYEGVLADVAELYPALWKKHRAEKRQFHFHWIFGSREWYADYLDRIHRERPESTHRCGFYDAANRWAFLFLPPEEAKAEGQEGESTAPAKPEERLRETAAYLAARQLLHRWSRDPEDPTQDRLDKSRAYWLLEGWPSFLAARRMKRPLVGPQLEEAKRFGWVFPPILRVLERESRLELMQYREPVDDYDEVLDQEVRPLLVRLAFTDLSWLLVRYLNEEPRRAAFERYLISQIEGTRHGIPWFEECFEVKGDRGWEALGRAVYGKVAKKD